jgi:hypothetical protein
MINVHVPSADCPSNPESGASGLKVPLNGAAPLAIVVADSSSKRVPV